MKKNYMLFLFAFALFFNVNAQSILFEQAVDGTSGIISDHLGDVNLATYSSDDFILDDDYIITTITAYGFDNAGDIGTLMSGLDVFIYGDSMGIPDSNPTMAGTGMLEILNLQASDPALTIVDNAFTIDIELAHGSEFSLVAGTYWLVVAPRIASDADRWSWYQSTAGGNAHIFDEGNFGGFDWTPFLNLGLTFDALAFTIEGTPALSVDEFSLANSISVFPNPTNNALSVKVSNAVKINQLTLYNVIGKQVMKVVDSNAMDLTSLASGVYMLKIETDSGSITKKIIRS